MINTYIFAGGDNTRWEADYPKEMALVNNTPVLEITVKQCGKFGLNPIIVTHKPEILEHPAFVYTKFITDQFPTLAHACRAVDWGDKCLFLLGDVFYTEYAWERTAQVALAYGNEVELFAFRFSESQHTKLLIAFNEAIRHWESGKGRGKLWETYRAFNGWDLDIHRIGENLCLIEDDTTDFDTIEEYEEFLEKGDWHE